jgi:hypothetical protein
MYFRRRRMNAGDGLDDFAEAKVLRWGGGPVQM